MLVYSFKELQYICKVGMSFAKAVFLVSILKLLGSNLSLLFLHVASEHRTVSGFPHLPSHSELGFIKNHLIVKMFFLFLNWLFFSMALFACFLIAYAVKKALDSLHLHSLISFIPRAGRKSHRRVTRYIHLPDRNLTDLQ